MGNIHWRLFFAFDNLITFELVEIGKIICQESFHDFEIHIIVCTFTSNKLRLLLFWILKTFCRLFTDYISNNKSNVKNLSELEIWM